MIWFWSEPLGHHEVSLQPGSEQTAATLVLGSGTSGPEEAGRAEQPVCSPALTDQTSHFVFIVDPKVLQAENSTEREFPQTLDLNL